jgi:chromosome segregation ATPase
MKRYFISQVLTAIVWGGIIHGAAAAPPDDQSGKTTIKDISRQAAEVSTTIKNYTVEQRDEAVKSAKSAIDDTDSHIHRLERKIDQEWDQMDQATRKKTRAALDALRKERTALAEWFGGLKHSSREAWDEVKGGFVKSYKSETPRCAETSRLCLILIRRRPTRRFARHRCNSSAN